MAEQEQVRLIGRADLPQKTGLSQTTIVRLRKTGKFPAHVQLSPRRVVWIEADLDAWLRGRRATSLDSHEAAR